MEIRTYLAILGRRKWVIAATVLATLIVGLVGTALLPPTYEASTTLRVTTTDESVDRASYDSVMYAGRLTNTYSKVATSASVLAELTGRVGLAEPPKVKVEVPANTELMQIIVEHHDPTVAADAANALADILIARARQLSVESAQGAREALGERLAQVQAELEQAQLAAQVPAQGAATSTDGTGRSDGATVGRAVELQQERYARLSEQYERLRSVETARANTMTVIEPAGVPLAPVRPRTSLNVAIALALGLVGGTGLAFLFENLDTKLYTTARIGAAAGLPVLGAIPAAPKRGQNGLFLSDSPEREAFRRLRTHLLACEGGAPRTLLVTSAEPSEGKSTVVANLASALAEAGRRVVVVDADLRRPTLHTLLALPNHLGLSSVLANKATWDQVIRDTRLPNVWAITSGSSPSNPAELFGSPRMSELVEHLARWFDVVLVDAPCLLGVADATTLARSVDGVVLVVNRGHAREQAVQAARAELTTIRATALGVVVNRAEPDESYRYYQASAPVRPSATRSPVDVPSADRPAAARLEAHGGHHGDSRGHHAVP